MDLIYEPTGKAAEYSPLALNVYTGGCEHRCSYCYCANGRAWSGTPRVRNLAGLEKEAAKADKQILLSFMSDPYQPCEAIHRNTRRALEILKAARCSVAILTKGGTRCLDDLTMFQSWPNARIKIGATLTFIDPQASLRHEPGAALPIDRLAALKTLHLSGVRTWASIEPVIDPAQSLQIIEASLPFIDGYKVGKLNHRASTTDWAAFGRTAIMMIRQAGKALYVKHDLRAAMPGFEFRPEETDPETMFLPERPKETQHG
mgnify:CR=1 FL=1